MGGTIKDIVRSSEEQPDEEVHRIKSRRILRHILGSLPYSHPGA